MNKNGGCELKARLPRYGVSDLLSLYVVDVICELRRKNYVKNVTFFER